MEWMPFVAEFIIVCFVRVPGTKTMFLRRHQDK
jgi:hypothetical protein